MYLTPSHPLCKNIYKQIKMNLCTIVNTIPRKSRIDREKNMIVIFLFEIVFTKRVSPHFSLRLYNRHI